MSSKMFNRFQKSSIGTHLEALLSETSLTGKSKSGGDGQTFEQFIQKVGTYIPYGATKLYYVTTQEDFVDKFYLSGQDLKYLPAMQADGSINEEDKKSDIFYTSIDDAVRESEKLDGTALILTTYTEKTLVNKTFEQSKTTEFPVTSIRQYAEGQETGSDKPTKVGVGYAPLKYLQFLIQAELIERPPPSVLREI